MTTTPVMTITDEQIAEIESATMLQAFRCCENPSIGGEYMGQCELVCCGNPESTEADISIAADDVLALISRLRAAEKDAEKWRARQAKILRTRPAIDAAMEQSK